MQNSLIFLAVTILFLCVFTLGIYLMRGRILLANRLLLILAAFVLTVKVAQYVYYFATGNTARFPVEFSTLTCIVFAIVIFADKKKVAYPFVSYAAFISGVAFNLLMFIGQDTFIELRAGNLWLLINIFVHDALLLGSLLMMGNFRFTHKTAWQIPLGCGVLIAWVFIAKYAIGYSMNIYTLRILEGSIFNNVWDTELPEVLASSAFLPVYYVVLALCIIASFILFYALNLLIYKHDRVDEYYLDEEEY